MRVSKRLIQQYTACLCKYRFIIVQHLLKDTVEFVEALLENGIEITCILYKEYSCDKNCFIYLLNKKIKIVELNGHDNSILCEGILQQAIDLTKIDEKKIVILDLGGEFAELVSECAEYIQCIVEDTHFGHWKYERSVSKNIVFSVAESKLKELEAKFVGRAIVDSVNRVLLDIGISLSGKKVLVIGYGMIGRNVASTLKDIGAQVMICDISEYKGVQVLLEGYQWCNSPSFFCKECDVIIGVTGKTSIDRRILTELSSNTYLVSGSSKQVEIDLDSLKNSSDKIYAVNDNISQYLYCHKNIFVLNDGKPINFLYKSIPDEIIDLVFSEMVMCITESEKSRKEVRQSIYTVSEKSIEIISHNWLKYLHEERYKV